VTSRLLSSNHVFIIAEAGVNHNGNMKIAKQLIDAAKNAGADGIKFQTFKAQNLLSRRTKLADYQRRNVGADIRDQYDLIRKLELPFEGFKELKDHCKKRKILFLSTPFDFESVDLLERLKVQVYKISSGDLTHLLLLEYIAKKKKEMILSTGMSNMDEVQEAVQIIRKAGNTKIILLHCVSEYPAPYKDVNLKAMLSLEKQFKLPVGYSDHTLGVEVAVAAVALGARVIEKHITLDRVMRGPDHKASMEPDEFKKMVRMIRHVTLSLGNGIKSAAACEMKNRNIARKSLVAVHGLKKGQMITDRDIVVKRPGTGIAPKDINRVVGRIVQRRIPEDSVIKWEQLA